MIESKGEDSFRNLSAEAAVARPSLRQDRRPPPVPRLSPSLHFPSLSSLPREPFRCSILCRRRHRSPLLASNAIHLTDRREGTALQKCGRPERGGRYTRGERPIRHQTLSIPRDLRSAERCQASRITKRKRSPCFLIPIFIFSTSMEEIFRDPTIPDVERKYE